MKKLFLGFVFVVLGTLLLSEESFAVVTPTPAQIDQFKKLPRAQQEAIARQFGIDIEALNTGSQRSPEPPKVAVVGKREASRHVAKSASEKKKQAGRGGLKPYGYDLFAGEPTTFAPVTEIPIPSEYVLGPGDELVIQLFGKDNETNHLFVNRDGTIQFPQLGPIAVAGIKFDRVVALLSKRVKMQMIGVHVSISLGKLRSMRVFVLGDAYRPGSYEVSSLSTITNVLFVSGGIKRIGSLRDIQLKRRGKVISHLDLYDLLLKGDTSKDKRLLPGDVVFIPTAGARVAVRGAFARPALYEVEPGETIADLMRMAGGLKPDANTFSSVLTRIEPNGVRRAISLNLSGIWSLSLKLRAGDDLSVGRINKFVGGKVVLTGAVTRSGNYQWRRGLKLSDIVGHPRRALLQSADLNYGLVLREINSRHDIDVWQFEPGNLDAAAPAIRRLRPNDRIVIFSQNVTVADRDRGAAASTRAVLLKPIINRLKSQSRLGTPAKIVSVNGAVTYPGEYPLARNISMPRLIVAAGGLSEIADTAVAEITHRTLDPIKGLTISHKQFPLSKLLHGMAGEHLSSRDTLSIRIIPDWIKQGSIKLLGEVKFPGTYLISRGETLKQVVERAGGLTHDAYPAGAIFTRVKLKVLEKKQLNKLSSKLENQIFARSLSDKKVLNDDGVKHLRAELSQGKAAGRLVINLRGLLKKTATNFRVENGDVLAVPAVSDTVTVLGEVNHATSHILEPGISVAAYITRSGGLTAQADKERIFVIKANGSVFLPESSHWFEGGENRLAPGDTIVVPLDTNYAAPLDRWATVTQIFYQSAVALAAIARL